MIVQQSDTLAIHSTGPPVFSANYLNKIHFLSIGGRAPRLMSIDIIAKCDMVAIQ
jgi:hypothetical protein